jgi:hypothetical protein
MSMKLQNARPLAAHDLDLQVLLSLDRSLHLQSAKLLFVLSQSRAQVVFRWPWRQIDVALTEPAADIFKAVPTAAQKREACRGRWCVAAIHAAFRVPPLIKWTFWRPSHALGASLQARL